jgi:hypothetical protein
MVEKVKNKSKLRFWGKGKKTKNSGKQVDPMSTPMMMESYSPMVNKSPGPAPATKAKTKTNTGQAQRGRINSAQSNMNMNMHQHPTYPSENKSHPATPPTTKHTARAKGMHHENENDNDNDNDNAFNPHVCTSTPQAARQSSESFTPKTLPPTPSPTRTSTSPGGSGTPIWQESDEERKIKAMARLHNLAKEHTKQIPKESIASALHSLPEEKQQRKSLFQGRDQQVIDAVLGINPCVPIETKAVIKEYASKPTSPTQVVNMAMLKEGSSKVFHLAKESVRESVGKLMSCAADLKDLDDGNTLCFSEFKKDGFMKRTSKYRDFYDNDDESSDNEDDDAGTFAGLSVKDGRESPVSRLGKSVDLSETTSFASEAASFASLGEDNLGRDMNQLHKNAPSNRGAPSPIHEMEERSHRMPIMRVSSSRRAAEVNRRANSVGVQHLQPTTSSGRGNGANSGFASLRESPTTSSARGNGATSGLQPTTTSARGNGATSGITSFRELTNNRHRGSRGAPVREAQANANPTTSNIPFDEDERSDVYDNGDVYDPVDLYGSSALGNGSPGTRLQLQLAEGNVYLAGSNQMKDMLKSEYHVQRRLSDRGI